MIASDWKRSRTVATRHLRTAAIIFEHQSNWLHYSLISNMLFYKENGWDSWILLLVGCFTKEQWSKTVFNRNCFSRRLQENCLSTCFRTVLSSRHSSNWPLRVASLPNIWALSNAINYVDSSLDALQYHPLQALSRDHFENHRDGLSLSLSLSLNEAVETFLVRLLHCMWHGGS